MGQRISWRLAMAVCAQLWSAAAFGQSGQLYVFGDSQFDTRFICTLSHYPGSAGGCSNGLNTVQWLPSTTGFAYQVLNNHAVGGAGTGPSFPEANAGWPSTADQVASFTASGGRIGPNDLVLLDGASNSAIALALNPSLTPSALAQMTLSEQASNTANLINAGARNIVVYTAGGPGLAAVYALGVWKAALGTSVPVVLPPKIDQYGAMYNAGLGAALAPLAGPGTQIRVFDFFEIYRRNMLNPAMYGFLPGTCAADPACVNAPKAVQNRHFFFDLHETEAGHLLMARYIGNLLGAQDALPVQADLATSIATGFADSLFARFDAARQMPVLPSSRDAFAADLPRKVPPTASPAAVINPWTVYAQGNYFGGNRDDRLSASGLGGGGGSYGSESGTIGLDYRLSPSLVVGAALNGATTRANLNQSGNIKVDSVQIAGYVSHNTRNWFVDAVVAYGDQKFDIDRPGVIDTLRAATNGGTFVAAARAGYLFDLDVVRLGPIAGLRYAHTRIGDYTETGDSVLTQHVDRQIAEQLVGSVGAQFARSLTFDSSAVNGYLNLTAERDLLGGTRWIISQETVALDLPIWTPAGRQAGTYGRAAGGFVASIRNGLSLFANATTTFARAGGNDHGGSAGLKYQF